MPMNSLASVSPVEAGWRTYLKALAFLAPGLFAWSLASVFVFPKLKEICSRANLPDQEPLQLLRVVDFIVANGTTIAVCLLVILALLEWRGRGWLTRRRFSVGIVVCLLNTAVLFCLFVMLILAVLAAPSLARG